jgi:hypothetical protein
MRQLAVFFIATCVFGQTAELFTKAPPHLDEALRANVSKFFQSHVDGKYRAAEEVVAPDSRDYFYESEKRRYKSFEIVKIDYSDNFTKATVVTALGVEWRTPRLGKIDVTVPATSMWKQVDDKWCWYVELKKEWETPFGTMSPGPDNNNNPIMAAFRGVTPEQVLNQVQISRRDLKLSSYEASTDSTEVVSKLPGEVELRLDVPAIRGLEAKLDKTKLKNGEKAEITFRYAPDTTDAKSTITATLHVSPTGQVFPIRITFAIPPEVEKAVRGR